MPEQYELTQEEQKLMTVFMENAEIATGLIINAMRNQSILFTLTLDGCPKDARETLISYFRMIYKFVDSNAEIKKLIE